ncbi:hypothetical protein NEHOM01_1480 [Nematocida homosporus]|uniref:uncharacterized protein n=1 Tax=Nematocida homosporus TaxID=1912981 RepID=UPI00221ECED0|nr:uncharacterized protein NEHOM01_1480 [Nematocida homosporus]KAI5186447.1 hypothetical protein NEHOM01_1480 [Nematocida homosporus]
MLFLLVILMGISVGCTYNQPRYSVRPTHGPYSIPKDRPLVYPLDVANIPIDIYLSTPVADQYARHEMDVFDKVREVFSIVETALNYALTKCSPKHYYHLHPVFAPLEIANWHLEQHSCPTSTIELSEHLSALSKEGHVQRSFILITPCRLERLADTLFESGQNSPYFSLALPGNKQTLTLIEAEPQPERLVLLLSSAILKALGLVSIEPLQTFPVYYPIHYPGDLAYSLQIPRVTIKEFFTLYETHPQHTHVIPHTHPH